MADKVLTTLLELLHAMHGATVKLAHRVPGENSITGIVTAISLYTAFDSILRRLQVSTDQLLAELEYLGRPIYGAPEPVSSRSLQVDQMEQDLSKITITAVLAEAIRRQFNVQLPAGCYVRYELVSLGGPGGVWHLIAEVSIGKLSVAEAAATRPTHSFKSPLQLCVAESGPFEPHASEYRRGRLALSHALVADCPGCAPQFYLRVPPHILNSAAIHAKLTGAVIVCLAGRACPAGQAGLMDRSAAAAQEPAADARVAAHLKRSASTAMPEEPSRAKPPPKHRRTQTK